MSGPQDQWRTFPVMQHATANHDIDIDGDGDGDGAKAKGRCDVVVLVQLPDRRWIAGGGSYEDQYRNDDGSWRIAYRRVVRPFDLAHLPRPTDLARSPTYPIEPNHRTVPFHSLEAGERSAAEPQGR